MTIIKRIIIWIINFLKKLFGKINKKTKKITKNKNIDKNKNLYNSTSFPPYMMIDDSGKLVLIKNIQDTKTKLKNNDIKKREIAKIIALLSNVGIDKKVLEDSLYKEEKLDNKKLESILVNCDSVVKENVYKIIDDYKKSSTIIKETISNLDNLTEYVKKNDISFETSNLINSELSNITTKTIEEKPVSIDKDVLNKIKNWDKNIISEVKLEYQKVNYVTISTVMIDKMMDKYKKIEEDYKNHRYNKSYYEKELNKIKEQINYLKKIKNGNVVYSEIEKLKKELYTKSKDKYDILYNNEIFMDVNKKCDELLNKVNQKVVDIKKEEKDKEEENKKEKLKEEYLKKILLRFKDLNLSRELILLHQEKEKEIDDYSDTSIYLNQVYLEFIEGVSDNFNYQRNKAKTELVKLYNDLNNIMSHGKKEKHISIDHINFQMEDLIDAVKIRKEEVEKNIDIKKNPTYSMQVDEKIQQFEEKFLEKEHGKTLKKSS